MSSDGKRVRKPFLFFLIRTWSCLVCAFIKVFWLKGILSRAEIWPQKDRSGCDRDTQHPPYPGCNQEPCPGRCCPLPCC